MLRCLRNERTRLFALAAPVQGLSVPAVLGAIVFLSYPVMSPDPRPPSIYMKAGCISSSRAYQLQMEYVFHSSRPCVGLQGRVDSLFSAKYQ